MTRSILCIITVVNILFQFVYMMLDKIFESGMLILLLIIFRPEYMIISGIVAFIVVCVLTVLAVKKILKHKKDKIFTDIICILLNIEYLFCYYYFIVCSII